jgi:pimeloyl-ACP methyl ester carboxylesterase
MARVNVRGAALECFEDGAGLPLVLVHGSASDYRSWDAQRSEFAHRFRVICYSRRYHWPNAPIPDGAEYAMAQQVEDLAALVEALGIAPAHLLGHSYGAFLCLLLAARRPELVRTLVLAEAPVLTLFVSSVPRPHELLRLLATRPRTAAAILNFGATGLVPAVRSFRRGDAERAVRAFGDAVFGPGGYDRFSESRKAQVRDNLSTIRAELLGPGFAALRDAEVRRAAVPALLVSGAHSVALFRRLTDRLEELLPRCERVEIPAASHAMHEDNPTAFNAAVLSFLTQHR